MYFPGAVVLISLAGCIAAQSPWAGKPGAKGKGGLGNLASLISDIPMTGPIFPNSYLASVGTGKYAAHYFSIPELPRHTIFAPKTLPQNKTTPILVWGNGGCMGHGLFQAPILIQMASQGVTIFANGALTKPSEAPSLDEARNAGQTVRENLMAKAIDFAEKQKASAKWSHLDLTKIAAAGQSCGGMETLAMVTDKRVRTLGIFNSGSPAAKGLGGGLLPLPNGGRIPGGSNITVPTWFFLGGTRDMANAKNNKDYNSMPAGVPAWAGDYASKGHDGTYRELNGGSYGILASHWLNFVFFGSKESGIFFKTDKAVSIGWSNLVHKNLDKIPTT